MQLLYEQIGSEADPNLASAAPQLQDVASSSPQVGALDPSHSADDEAWVCPEDMLFRLEDLLQS